MRTTQEKQARHRRGARRCAVLIGVLAMFAVGLTSTTVATAGAEPIGASAVLEASQKGDPTATGDVELQLDAVEGVVCYQLTYLTVTEPTAAHIHAGGAGTTGGVVVNFDLANNGLDGCVDADTAVVDAILGAPGDYYVNIHNAEHPAGAARGQVTAPVDGTSSFAVSGAGFGDPDGTGSITMTLDPDTGSVCYQFSSADIDTPTAAHIHEGADGVQGGVVVNLELDPAYPDACVNGGAAVVEMVLANPDGYYVNVHNATYPAGAIRGQVTLDPMPAGSPQPIPASAPLEASQKGDPTATGDVELQFDAAEGVVCYVLSNLTVTEPTAAHIHSGGAGTTGGVVVNFDLANNGLDGCVDADTATIDAILGAPGDYYVNIHNAEYPAGAARGQVTAPADGTSSFAVAGAGFGDPDGTGFAALTLDPDAGIVCYQLSAADIDTPSAAHIHAGADGAQGGVVVNLALDPNFTAGCVDADPAVVAMVLANPDGYYVNVHNATYPAGAIRGQIVVDGLVCQGMPVTVNMRGGDVPTDGDDVIMGTPGDDVIPAGAGDDIVCGLGGNDRIWGQAGNDIIDGGAGDDVLRGSDGDDVVIGGDGNDDLNGGRGNDVVTGNAGMDTTRGGTGDDIVDGGSGDDPLVAGNGGRDVVSGGDGDDKVTGGPRPDNLYGGAGDDELKGLGGADFVAGDSGDDDLRGGKQADHLDGGAGTDSCNGGTTGGDPAPGEFDSTVNCETQSNIP